MANVVNRETLEHRPSVNTPDYPSSDWLINPPSWSIVETVEQKYRKLNGDDVAEMTQAEQSAVDIAELSAAVASSKAEAIAMLSANNAVARFHRALSVVNKREMHALKGGRQGRATKTLAELAVEAAQAIQNEDIE